MRKIALGISVALTIALAGCGGNKSGGEQKGEAVAAVAAPEGKQWIDVAGKTTEGGYKIGNPDAKVQLVEYGAITCPGCAQFAVASHEELMEMVNTGKMSFEFRPYLVHGVQDLPGFMLAQCNGPEGFIPLTDQMYRNQASWLGNLSKITEAEQAEFGQIKDPVKGAAWLGGKFGLVEFVKERGVSEDAARACLADANVAQEMIKTTETAQAASGDQKVTGTPTFFLNGSRLDVAGWDQIKIKLKNAGVRD